MKGHASLNVYLDEAASLDVNRLQQQRYSLRAQKQLDWVKTTSISKALIMYTSAILTALHFVTRHCIYLRKDPVQYYYDLAAPFVKGFFS